MHRRFQPFLTPLHRVRPLPPPQEQPAPLRRLHRPGAAPGSGPRRPPERLHLPRGRAAPPAAAGPIPGAAGRRRSAAGLRGGSGAVRRGAGFSASSFSSSAAAGGRCGGSWGGSRPQRAPVPPPPPWTAAGAAGAHSSVSSAAAGPGPVPSPSTVPSGSPHRAAAAADAAFLSRAPPVPSFRVKIFPRAPAPHACWRQEPGWRRGWAAGTGSPPGSATCSLRRGSGSSSGSLRGLRERRLCGLVPPPGWGLGERLSVVPLRASCLPLYWGSWADRLAVGLPRICFRVGLNQYQSSSYFFFQLNLI